MFERFTTNSRRVVVLAQEEARRLRHDYIGTEHELLGLLTVDDPVVQAAIGDRITRDKARQAVEEIVGRGEHAPTGHIPFTPRAKKVLELSLREALRLRHRSIQPGHILLGLLREGEGVGAQVLAQAGLDFERAKARSVAELDRRPDEPRPEPALVPDDVVESFLLQVPPDARDGLRQTIAEPPAEVAERAAALAQALDPGGGAVDHAFVLAILFSPGEHTIREAVLSFGLDPDALRRQALASL